MFASADHTSARRRSAPLRAYASRVQAALTALAFVLASLFGILHEAKTTHVRCAEHGELIDRDATVANSAGAGHQTTLRGAVAGTLQRHEHCSLTSATRDSRLVPHPPAIASVQVAISGVAALLPRVVAARGSGLYRTAPKTSPPV